MTDIVAQAREAHDTAASLLAVKKAEHADAQKAHAALEAARKQAAAATLLDSSAAAQKRLKDAEKAAEAARLSLESSRYVIEAAEEHVEKAFAAIAINERKVGSKKIRETGAALKAEAFQFEKHVADAVSSLVKLLTLEEQTTRTANAELQNSHAIPHARPAIAQALEHLARALKRGDSSDQLRPFGGIAVGAAISTLHTCKQGWYTTEE